MQIIEKHKDDPDDDAIEKTTTWMKQQEDWQAQWK
jgi:hypothetical protein